MSVKKSIYIICSFLLIISSLGIFLLKSNVTGYATKDSVFVKEEFVFVPSDETNPENAIDNLISAEQAINEMDSFGVNTDFLRDTLLLAKQYYVGNDFQKLRENMQEIKTPIKQDYAGGLIQVYGNTPEYERKAADYEEVARLSQLIKFKQRQIYRILDYIEIMEEKEKSFNEIDLTGGAVSDVSESRRLLTEQKKAFEEGRYDDAEELLAEADAKLDLTLSEVKRNEGLTRLSKNFFEKYWWHTLSILVLLGIIAKPVAVKTRKNLAKKRLDNMRLELKSISELIRKAQEDCFKGKTITVSDYKIRIERYMAKKAEIKHTIPVLESIAYGKKIERNIKPKGVLEVKR